MKNSKLKIQNFRLLFCILHFAFCISAASAQSTNQSFPTPVTSNEINGTIKARDIGDSRLTSYFYTFNGNQGDVFINVVTKNLDGDIDVFTAENLRPLTKITVYSDNPDSETGRVIYLRQPQKLVLRVEGRTPTDEPATFRIKFAGSFQPIAGIAETDESKQPKVTSKEETDVRVNSVGTIIAVKPKPTPTPKPTVAKVEKEETKKPDEKEAAKVEKEETENLPKKDEPEENKEDKKPEVIVTENVPEKKDAPEVNKEETVAEEETPKKTVPTNKRQKTRNPRTAAKTETNTKPTPAKKTEPTPVEPSELASINLIVLFKDGRKIERPMSEILKFGVDKGILTIIAKDGSIGRYSILDIAKITVE
jgi:hypothetical protein